MNNNIWLWSGLNFGLPDLGLGVEGPLILMENLPECVNILCHSVKHEAGLYVDIFL